MNAPAHARRHACLVNASVGPPGPRSDVWQRTSTDQPDRRLQRGPLRRAMRKVIRETLPDP